MITQTSLNHPKTIKRIKRALWLAKLAACKNGQRGTEYVKNKKGNNYLRIDVYKTGELQCYASRQQNVTALIKKALEG